MSVYATQTNREPRLAAGTNPLVYAPRACHAFGTVIDRDRTYKIYVILSDLHTLADCPPLPVLQGIVLQAVSGWDANEDHPVGFAILHLARDGNYVLASRWNNANNLRHRVFSIDLSRPDPVPEALSDTWLIACIWELRLIKREVDSWISAVLSRGEPALTTRAIEDYAAIQFTGAL